MDMPLNRRLRLKEWFENRSIPEAEKSYISQLINGKSSFGEKAARRLESTYGMSMGYLDAAASEVCNRNQKELTALDSQEKELLESFRSLKLQKHRYQVLGIIKDFLDSESVQHIKSGDHSHTRRVPKAA